MKDKPEDWRSPREAEMLRLRFQIRDQSRQLDMERRRVKAWRLWALRAVAEYPELQAAFDAARGE